MNTFKSVVVTGAGSGIGRTIASVLAARGWQVVATDFDEASAAETAALLDSSAGQTHEFQRLNVSDAAEAGRVADDVADRLSLDAWINNAGTSSMQKFLELPIDSFDKTIEVNLKGVFVCGQAAARAMVRTENEGAIVNIASMAGKQGRVPFVSHYVASKFGVVGLTQAMALELAAHRIRVNSVCPGFVATPMQSRGLAWQAELRQTTPEKVKQHFIDQTPLGRLQDPDDVARAVAFLVSEDAEFITGEALSVNGGAFMD